MKLTFEPAFLGADLFYEKPIPAMKALPEWYKEMSLTVDGTAPQMNESKNGPNYTVKGCSPFLDSLGAGYILTLPCDISVRLDDSGELNFSWLSDIPGLISSHDYRQVIGVPQSFHSDGGALKWKSGWTFHTPKGYSMLFTHPLNRQELPFYTLSGIVETDRYQIATEFPFLMHRDRAAEPFILPKGTPIVQAIPIKRDDWNATEIKFDEEKNIKATAKLKSKILRSYKNQFWIKKNYT